MREVLFCPRRIRLSNLQRKVTAVASDEERQPDTPAAPAPTEDTPIVDPPPAPPPDTSPLGWMNDTLEWGIRAVPGKHGMTMRDLNLGSYGRIPEYSADMSRRPRGAFPIPGVPRTDVLLSQREGRYLG